MPGLGAEAMIFLYAGLSGLTVLAGYDVLRWFRRIIGITISWSEWKIFFILSQSVLPFPSALCDDLWQYPMVFYSRNPAGNVVLEKCENIVEKNLSNLRKSLEKFKKNR